MSQALSLIWAGGEHDFRLTLGHLRALQDACNAGPFEIRNRLLTQTARVDDVTATLRLGLIGGGMGKPDALKLVETTAENSGLMALILPALSVLTHALVGPEDDPVGDGEGKTMGETLPPESGDFPVSTETGQ